MATEHLFGEKIFLAKIKNVGQDGEPVKLWVHEKAPNALNSRLFEYKDFGTMR